MFHDDVELELSEQESQVLTTVHNYAEQVLRPIGKVLDRLDDPADVIAPDSPLWEAMEQYISLGLDQMHSPDAGMSPLEAARLQAMIQEEMFWGDSGLAIAVSYSGFIQPFIMFVDDTELHDRFGKAGKDSIGCWAPTEPDHGSDSIAFAQPYFSDKSIRPNCIAKRDGDDYVISGQKAAWVSCGTVASVALLMCAIDGEPGFAGSGAFIVPLDLPGVTKGKPLDKLGQRALNQGEIFFQDVRVPARWMIAGPESYPQFLELMLSHGNAHMASTFVGVGRAAYEHALEYAHERKQGGVALAQHQSVQNRLFQMFMKVQASRAIARRVTLYNAVNTPKFHQSVAAKVFSTNSAFEVATAACQMFGGNGISREYPVEKLLRDARTSLVEDGCNEFLGLMAGSRLHPFIG